MSSCRAVKRSGHEGALHWHYTTGAPYSSVGRPVRKQSAGGEHGVTTAPSQVWRDVRDVRPAEGAAGGGAAGGGGAAPRGFPPAEPAIVAEVRPRRAGPARAGPCNENWTGLAQIVGQL